MRPSSLLADLSSSLGGWRDPCLTGEPGNWSPQGRASRQSSMSSCVPLGCPICIWSRRPQAEGQQPSPLAGSLTT